MYVSLFINWSNLLLVVIASASINILWLLLTLLVQSYVLKYKIKEVNLGADKLLTLNKQPKVTLGLSFIITTMVTPDYGPAEDSSEDKEPPESEILKTQISSLSIKLVILLITYIASGLHGKAFSVLFAYFLFQVNSVQLKSYINPISFWSVAFMFSLIWALFELISNLVLGNLVKRYNWIAIPYVLVMIYLFVTLGRMVVDLIK